MPPVLTIVVEVVTEPVVMLENPEPVLPVILLPPVLVDVER